MSPLWALNSAKRALVTLLACASISARTQDRALIVTAPAKAGSRGVDSVELAGRYDRPQLLVWEASVSGGRAQAVDGLRWESDAPNVVEVDSSGRLMPRGEGEARISVYSKTGAGSISVASRDVDHEPETHFGNQIVPIFTKTGCNGGGCHGKSGGQNGFRLSLLGFEPDKDYEWLVKESRGRRITPGAPDHSLLLLKATAAVPHGGGKRIEKDSEDYETVARWIRQGLPMGAPDAPVVERIEVFPNDQIVERDSKARLVVVAHYSDGRRDDVTRSALFESNRPELAEATSNGVIQFANIPGDVGVMVRFQGKVGVYRAMIPLGISVVGLPEPKNYVDEKVFAKLERAGMPASGLAADEVFLRRVTLDIAGRLPTRQETDRFLSSPGPSDRKRAEWIDELLASADYAEHFANKWSALLRNKRESDPQKAGTFAFYNWIRDRLNQNVPYDQFVSRILTASGDIQSNPPVAWYRQVDETTELLEDTAQLFLGSRIQCAQCHHHPFEKWSQKDYFQFAAFFSRLGREAGLRPQEDRVFHRYGKATARNTATGEQVYPAGLGAAVLDDLPAMRDPREALAEWMRSEDNPFFAKSLVNRYWKHFMGQGLVEPEDDIRATNPATNPELLEALAERFVASGYDLKQLIRDICNSKTYQLDSIPNEHNRIDRQYFSRFYPRRLPAEPALDAIDQVTGVDTQFPGLPLGARAVGLPDNGFNKDSYFLTVFGRPDSSSACECERSNGASLAQSLHLLNSKTIQEKLVNSSGMAARLAADERPHEQRIEELYLAAFSRYPTDNELSLALTHIDAMREKGDANPVRVAYEDLVWALLNTKEFLFNH